VAKPRSIRIPTALEQELEDEFAARGVREWTTGVLELLNEAVRMRKVPGIAFVDSLTGRRAVLAGTGLEVWEVVAMWRALNENEDQLAQAFAWLPVSQLRSALAYYRLYPADIDARLALEDRWTAEQVRANLAGAAFGPGLSTGSR
jgi:uncharacterized protein (DUF433 family)